MDLVKQLQDKIRNLKRKVQVLDKIIQLTNQWAQNEFGVHIPQEILACKLDEKTSGGSGSDDDVDIADQSDIIDDFGLDLGADDTYQDQESPSSADLNPADFLDSSNSSSQSRHFTKDPIVVLERLSKDHEKFKSGQIHQKTRGFSIKNEKLKKRKITQSITSTSTSTSTDTRADLICGTCGLTCERKKDLKLHLSATGHGRYPCTICSYSFDIPWRLKDHLKSHDDRRERNFACPSCDKKFTTIKYLNMHVARESCKNLECPFEDCHLKFSTDVKFEAHLKLHNPPGLDNDGDNLNDDGVLEVLRKVEKIGEFKCRFCEKSYATKKGLRNHSSEFHNVNYKGEDFKYKCTWPGCDKSFEMEFYFNRHVKLHDEPEKPEREICDQCGMSVKRSTLKEHQDRVHFKKKNCKCTFPGCNKLFYKQSEIKRCLKRHLTTTAEKEASKIENAQTCDQCGKQFVGKRNLTVHILAVHENVKPHKCSVGECTMAFSEKRALMIHYSVHLNPKRKEFNEQFSQNRPEGLMEFLENINSCRRDRYVKKAAKK